LSAERNRRKREGDQRVDHGVEEPKWRKAEGRDRKKRRKPEGGKKILKKRTCDLDDLVAALFPVELEFKKEMTAC